jgi:cache domain-containing protein
MRSTIVIFVLGFAAFGLLLGFAESFDTQPRDPINAAVSDVESRIDRSVRAMQTTSELPEVKSTDYIGLIDEAQMGIPEDADVEKREVARQLISEHPEIASIFFLTPSGDIYIGEPYEQQAQLPRLNYADRDWYKGVRATNEPYVSAVFMSAAIHVPAIAVAVPVFQEDQLVGYWVAITNLGDMESSLKGLSGGSRVLLVDHNGTEVADTGRTGELTELRSFAHLQSVQAALSGKTGSLVEQVDGVETNARFAPVNAHPNTWAVVFLEPAEP